MARKKEGLAYFLLEWTPCFIYVVLYVVLDLLIASEGHTDEVTGKRRFNYTPGVLVLLAEVGKWVITLTMLLIQRCLESQRRRGGPKFAYSSLEEQEAAEAEAAAPAESLDLDWSDGVWFAVPSALYACWNVLNYESLLHVPLSVYSIVYQSVLFFSAFLWSVTFDRKLSSVQWAALLLLGAGVFVVHLRDGFNFVVDLAVFWVLAQAMVSAVASVYNEFLYKRPRRKTSINVQNFYLYTWTSLFTTIYLIATEDVEIFKPENFFRGFSDIVVIIVVVSIALGLSVSLILKHRDVVVKLFAQAIHSPIEVVAAHFILDTEFTPLIGLATALIAISTYMYYRPESQYNYAHKREHARAVRAEKEAETHSEEWEKDPFAPLQASDPADVHVDEELSRKPRQMSMWEQSQSSAGL